LNPLVDVLYNLAQVCREAGREEEALHLYEQTQQRSQDAATKEDCQRHIDTLSLKLSAAADQRAAQALLGKDYPGAIAAWESAYKLSKQPAALYRIAAAYRQNGQRKESIAAYERYLASAGGDPNVDKAKTELAALRVEESQPAVTKGDKPGISLVDGGAQPAEAKTPVYKKWWFWTIIGVVAAGAVAGGVAGALARPQTMTVVADPFSDIPAQNQKVLSPQ
jgi:tetratricopeptide (TPR) repeat protein